MLDGTCVLCQGAGIDSVHHILLECDWDPYTAPRHLMFKEVLETISHDDRTWWNEATSDQVRLVLLGKSLEHDLSMQNRRLRDRAVKRFMVSADEERQLADIGPLCGSAPGPPPFSLEEALMWAQDQADMSKQEANEWIKNLMESLAQ